MATKWVFARRRGDGALDYNELNYNSIDCDIWTLLHEHWRDPTKVDWLVTSGNVSAIGKDIGCENPPTPFQDCDERIRPDDSRIEGELNIYDFQDRTCLTRYLPGCMRMDLSPHEREFFVGGRVLTGEDAEYIDGWMAYMFEWDGSDWLCHSDLGDEPWRLNEKAALHKRIFDAAVRDVPAIGTDAEFEALVADIAAFDHPFPWHIITQLASHRTRWSDHTARRFADFLVTCPEPAILNYCCLDEHFPQAILEDLYRRLGRSYRRAFEDHLPENVRRRIDLEHPPVLTEEEIHQDRVNATEISVRNAANRRVPIPAAAAAVPIDILAAFVCTFDVTSIPYRGAVRVLASKADAEIPPYAMPMVIRERKNAARALKAAAKSAAGT